MEETTVKEEFIFPDKPVIDEKASALWKSFGSVVLFIAAYYMFFDKSISHIFLLVFVIFIHELGHFLAMKYYDYKDVRMFFIPFLGAMVTGEKEDVSQKQKAIILLAGPLPGILIGLPLYYYGYVTSQRDIIVAANMFIFLNMFNLIPIKPLDGGNLIGVLFFDKKEIIQTVFQIVSAVGLAVVALYLESYVLLVIPAVMLMTLTQKIEIKRVKNSLKFQNIDYTKPYVELTNAEYWLIRDQLITHMGTFARLNAKEYVESKREKQIIELIKSLTDKHPAYDISILGKLLFLFIWILFIIGPIIALALIIRFGQADTVFLLGT